MERIKDLGRRQTVALTLGPRGLGAGNASEALLMICSVALVEPRDGAAGAGAGLAHKLPVCLSPSLSPVPRPRPPAVWSFVLRVWGFCHGGWGQVLPWGSLSSLLNAQSAPLSPLALWWSWLAQELLQLISGLRKPSVVCQFFHPLFFSEFRPFPSQ